MWRRELSVGKLIAKSAVTVKNLESWFRHPKHSLKFHLFGCNRKLDMLLQQLSAVQLTYKIADVSPLLLFWVIEGVEYADTAVDIGWGLEILGYMQCYTDLQFRNLGFLALFGEDAEYVGVRLWERWKRMWSTSVVFKSWHILVTLCEHFKLFFSVSAQGLSLIFLMRWPENRHYNNASNYPKTTTAHHGLIRLCVVLFLCHLHFSFLCEFIPGSKFRNGPGRVFGLVKKAP